MPSLRRACRCEGAPERGRPALDSESGNGLEHAQALREANNPNLKAPIPHEPFSHIAQPNSGSKRASGLK